MHISTLLAVHGCPGVALHSIHLSPWILSVAGGTETTRNEFDIQSISDMSWTYKDMFCFDWDLVLCLSNASESLCLERHQRLYEPHVSSQTSLRITGPFAHMHRPSNETRCK